MREQRDYIRYNIFVENKDCLTCNLRNASVNISDLSCTGLGICVNERLSIGDKLELELNVPKDDIPMFVVGEVVWVAKDTDMPGIYRAGVRLAKISPCDKQRLNNYIISTVAIT